MARFIIIFLILIAKSGVTEVAWRNYGVENGTLSYAKDAKPYAAQSHIRESDINSGKDSPELLKKKKKMRFRDVGKALLPEVKEIVLYYTDPDLRFSAPSQSVSHRTYCNGKRGPPSAV